MLKNKITYQKKTFTNVKYKYQNKLTNQFLTERDCLKDALSCSNIVICNSAKPGSQQWFSLKMKSTEHDL